MRGYLLSTGRVSYDGPGWLRGGGFHSLRPLRTSDTDIELTGPTITEKTGEDASADSDQSVYFDALEAEDDTPYFLQGAEPPPREEWEIAAPIDFSNVQGVLQISHQLDELFLSEKEIETPLGMDDIKQKWKWADVGSRRMPRSPLTYPAIMLSGLWLTWL